MAVTGTKSLGVDVASKHTVAKHVLGMTAWAEDGTRYVYAKAGGTIAAGDSVSPSLSGVELVYTALATGKVAVAVAPIGFSANEYGWFVDRGMVSAKVVAATAAGVAVSRGFSAAGVPAVVADTGLAAQSVFGVTLTAESGGKATVLLA